MDSFYQAPAAATVAAAEAKRLSRDSRYHWFLPRDKIGIVKDAAIGRLSEARIPLSESAN
ncbi:hypothetical protein PN499_11220 [Kamptonema animale CS-326]|jgi:hypothetical protein|uniref:hypothetical protein n=1 Tax=Kamptonema TaxID=1501433 RepID=UPI0002ECF11A|nr:MULTISPECIES: hypothetical protein [Kamptonema]MDB9511756.1 hypothetical protein [Kamptonema animale CS-326]